MQYRIFLQPKNNNKGLLDIITIYSKNGCRNQT